MSDNLFPSEWPDVNARWALPVIDPGPPRGKFHGDPNWYDLPDLPYVPNQTRALLNDPPRYIVTTRVQGRRIWWKPWRRETDEYTSTYLLKPSEDQ